MSSLIQTADLAPAVISSKGTLTREALKTLATKLEQSFSQEGIQRVLIRTDDPGQIVAVMEASHRAGSALWIAHTTVPAVYLREIVESFNVQVILSESGEERRAAGACDHISGSRIHLMTSGTTGRPKVVTHTLESLLSRIGASAGLPANRGGQWLLTYQATTFAGLQVILTAMLSGGAIVVPETRTPLGFFEAATRAQVTQISGTPTFWRSFLLLAFPGALPGLRQITLGGEPVDQPTLARLKATFPAARITHIYASTEAGVIFAVHDELVGFPAEWLARPVQGVHLRIRNGVLEVKTPRGMQGYARTDTESAQVRTDDGWLATGDLVGVTGDRVRFLGREDDIINVGGAKVYPQSVEAFLLGLEGVLEARVRGIANPISGFLVGAEAVLAAGLDPEAARLRILVQCREGLAHHEVPRILKIVDAIQVHESGKKA
jgi:acyl-coenzyme A synthetase/AMP-(fatty) acid ligase